jgi:hypothetical protein
MPTRAFDGSRKKNVESESSSQARIHFAGYGLIAAGKNSTLILTQSIVKM